MFIVMYPHVFCYCSELSSAWPCFFSYTAFKKEKPHLLFEPLVQVRAVLV